MATIINKNAKNGEKQEAPQKPMLGTPQAASAPASQGQQVAPKTGGGFTNLSSYLSANKQAGGQIASKIGEGIQKEVGEKKANVNKEAEQFRNAVEAANKNVQQGQQFLQQITPQANTTQQGPQVQDVRSITNNPELLKQFTGLSTGTTQAQDKAKLYGATGAEGEYGDVYGATQDLAKTYGTRASQIQGGDRFGLLKEFLANPKQQYTRGLSSLDNALLQRDKSKNLENLNKNLQRESVSELKAKADQLSALNTSGQGVLSAGTEAQKSLSEQTGKNIESANKSFQDNLASINASRKAEQDWAKQQFENLKSGKEVDAEFAAMMGLTSGQRLGNVLSDKDLSNYFSMGPTELTSGLQAATPEQLSQMNALYQLAGQNFTAPELSAAAIANANKFDVEGANKLTSEAYKQMQDAAKQGAFRAQGASKYTANQLIDKLGQDIGNKQAMENYINALKSDWTTPEYNSVYNKLAGLVGSDANWQMQHELQNIYDYLNKQGYYNTVNIAGSKGFTPKV